MADSADVPPQRLPEHVTPFMAQYLAAKDKHPEALLFFRMGDFYELFFEDAEKAAATLGITLTRRGQHKGEDIPMAGVPVHAADSYLQRLIRAGLRVAVCEQLEDPAEARKRGSKAIVRRDVVRVVTPGTITEDTLLDQRVANILAAVAIDGEGAAVSWADVSTGAFAVRAVQAATLGEELAALSHAELLHSDADLGLSSQFAASGAALTVRPAAKADPKAAERRLKAAFEVSTLDGFGAFSRVELAAMGMLLDYIELTQAGAAPRLSQPQQLSRAASMAIDPATRASLEIERTQRGQREGSLVHAVDRTVTAAGARLLAERIARPLTDVAAIQRRLDAVDWFLNADRRQGVRAALQSGADLARALQRLALGRGGPRDLGALRDGLAAGDSAARAAFAGEAPDEIREACAALLLGRSPELRSLHDDLRGSLVAELPLLARDGNFIGTGVDADLDAARALRDDSRRVVASLQATYAEETGLPIKIRHNGVLGYHVDATLKQAETLERAPHSARFTRRHGSANSIRFTTAELVDLDSRIARAGEEALARELAIFERLAARAGELAEQIRAAASALASLDVAAAAAAWSVETGAVRPEIDESRTLLAEGVRHPVVAEALRRQGQAFTPNDCRLDGEGRSGPRLLLVTGPNMAGKSTYLRQTVLLAILAQAGLHVPAKRLRLGVADRVFSRVGASDDLARGRSTFMTEMVETAAILNQAGPRALVILDEIGRGTATYDGLAIAWACVEHLHEVNGCRAIFATHYHELTGLAERLAAGANANLRAKEWKGDLVFLHEVSPGAADRSYGIQVAKLAGLPKGAVERARAVLARLEAGKGARTMTLPEELPLFAEASAGVREASEIESALSEINPDALTPKEALDLIYRLKALIPKGA